MTTRAFLPKSSVVYIVAIVAINTTSARGVDLLPGPRVTRHTRELGVCPIDNEARFLGMIKIPYPPVAHVMTDIAGCPQLSLVRIVFAMATDTCARRVLEPLRLMAVLACHFQVASHQGEACLRVIKPHPLPA